MDALRWLRLVSGLGLGMLLLGIAFEGWLDYHSPVGPDAASGKTVQIRQRGGNIYVTPREFFLDRAAYGAGAALMVGSVLGFFWISRRR
jgi:hypothetical protein